MPKKGNVLPEDYRRILVAAQFHARDSAKSIAKRAGCSEHKVHNVLRRLQEQKVISPCLHLNLYALGFSDYGIYVSRGSESSRASNAYVKHVNAQPGVYWFARLGATYQLGIAYLSKHISDLDAFMTSLTPSESNIFFQKAIAMRTRWTIFPARHLIGRTETTDLLHCQSNVKPVELDEVDRCVLRTLAMYPSEELRHLARRTGLPISTVSYRIDRLKEQGVLLGFIYRINPAVIGLETIRIHVVERSVTPQTRKAMLDFCASQPNVVALNHCIGPWDYEIRLDVRTLHEVDDFCDALNSNFSKQILSLQLLHQYEILKWNAYPFPK